MIPELIVTPDLQARRDALDLSPLCELDGKAPRMDAISTAFAAQFLEAWNPSIFEVLRPSKSYTKLMAVDTQTVDPGADTYSYYVSDTIGDTKTIQGGASITDLPRADAKGTYVTRKVQTEANSYAYTLLELKQAALAARRGVAFPLDQQRRTAAFRAHEEKWNNVALFGDTGFGSAGLFTDSNITNSQVAANGTGSSRLWANKTGTQRVQDVLAAKTAVITASKGVHMPNKLGISPQGYSQLEEPLGDNEDKTCRKYIEEQLKLTVEIVPELDGTLASGADGFIVYDDNPMNGGFYVAESFYETPPQPEGLGYVTSCQSRFVTGFVGYYPQAYQIRRGI